MTVTAVITQLEREAELFARWHHAAVDQRRKYTGLPYIEHPEAVAGIVRSVPHTPEMIAAAWCHDTVEDTKATIDDVRRALGDEVAGLVDMVTDVSNPTQGDRKARKALDRIHLAGASPAGMTIKLADLLDNTLTIVDHDREFAALYLKEKDLLLDVLHAGDRTLHAAARALVASSLRRLHGGVAHGG